MLYLSDCNQGEEVRGAVAFMFENAWTSPFGLKSTISVALHKELSTITDTVEEMRNQLEALVQQPDTIKRLVKRVLQIPNCLKRSFGRAV